MTPKKEQKQVKPQPAEEKPRMPLAKGNLVMMGICLLLIVVGFALMTGSANTGDTFNADIFDTRRTVVAPFITFAGFVLMAFAIIVKTDRKK